MSNLGGHDLPSLLAAFEAARAHDRPVCFIAYTIKGHGLPLAGHKDNHAGLMTPAQVDDAARGDERPRRATNGSRSRACDVPEPSCAAFLASVPFFQTWPRRTSAPAVAGPGRRSRSRSSPSMSTQAGFGLLMHEIAKGDTDFARPHRHHLARRDGLDQSRRLGEPARPVRARGDGRRVQARAHPLDLQLGLLAARASISNSASPR